LSSSWVAASILTLVLCMQISIQGDSSTSLLGELGDVAQRVRVGLAEVRWFDGVGPHAP